MRVSATWYGTAAVHLVVDESLGVFFDPWFARPRGARPRIMADVATVDLEPLDVILVSHSHFDHVYNLPDLVHRYPQVQAYVPAVTTQNCRRLCSGAIFKDYACRLTESDWARIQSFINNSRTTKSRISRRTFGGRSRPMLWATNWKSRSENWHFFSSSCDMTNARVDQCGRSSSATFLI